MYKIIRNFISVYTYKQGYFLIIQWCMDSDYESVLRDVYVNMCIIHIVFRALFRCIRCILLKILSCLCSPLWLIRYMFTRKCFSKPCDFFGGFLLGTLYYYCLLTKLPFPPYVHYCLMVTVGLLLGKLHYNSILF